ncbi:hypothetical protein Ddye_024254 [Dipteronia dyeriana]|uniref:R13L1/DRL21-like LRR repeat region domain-containing protein n=1 Tax=Dipteronia dyeriana TaxID=168575 RepID=A0AAD9TUM3_9ROSI|nr:hypothetical protein Ddye_024254 [Dipteronia dyeriana]
MLQPRTNLISLILKRYGGIRFSSWLGDASFSNMTVLWLERCEDCTTLPLLRLLISLKDLTIIDMERFKTLASEFYGAGCLSPFQSPEILKFDNLKEWDCWESTEKIEHVETFVRVQETGAKARRSKDETCTCSSYSVIHEENTNDINTFLERWLPNTNLRVFSIFGCEILKALLRGMHTINSLGIRHCPNNLSRQFVKTMLVYCTALSRKSSHNCTEFGSLHGHIVSQVIETAYMLEVGSIYSLNADSFAVLITFVNKIFVFLGLTVWSTCILSKPTF